MLIVRIKRIKLDKNFVIIKLKERYFAAEFKKTKIQWIIKK